MSKYKIQITNKFKKSYKKIMENKKYNEDDFRRVIELLARDVVLPAKYHNHLLEPKSNRFMGMPYKTQLVINIQEE